MDIGIYRILENYFVLIGAIHFGNLILPGIVMWGSLFLVGYPRLFYSFYFGWDISS